MVMAQKLLQAAVQSGMVWPAEKSPWSCPSSGKSLPVKHRKQWERNLPEFLGTLSLHREPECHTPFTGSGASPTSPHPLSVTPLLTPGTSGPATKKACFFFLINIPIFFPSTPQKSPSSACQPKAVRLWMLIYFLRLYILSKWLCARLSTTETLIFPS